MILKNYKKVFLLVGDITIFYVSLILTLLIKDGDISSWPLHKYPFLWAHILWILIFYSAGMYDWERFPPSRRYYIARLSFYSMLIAGISAMALFYFIPYFSITPKTNLLLDLSIIFFLTILWRAAFLKIASRANKINVLFFGSTNETKTFADFLSKHQSLGYDICAVLEETQFDHKTTKNFMAQNKINLVVVEQDILKNEELVKIFYDILPTGITIEKFSEFYESITGRVPTSIISKSWFLENLAELQKGPFESVKKLLDLTLAIVVGLLTVIITPIVALLIKLDSKGPVFFRQKRIGRNGKIFEFIKFRSMVQNAEEIGGMKEEKSDARHTRVGKILRKTYLDEFPQFINVLSGDMSFVGPRPERPEYVEILKTQVPFYNIRHMVRPGITGHAQINMENDASVEDAPIKLQYDLYYIKNRSLVMDLAILLKTMATLVKRSGR